MPQLSTHPQYPHAGLLSDLVELLILADFWHTGWEANWRSLSVINNVTLTDK